jgi:AraC family transcriptional regulator
MSARACNIAAHVAVRGLNLQVLDYRWSAGESITEVEPSYILRWRMYPAQVSVAARLRPTGLKSFGRLMFFPADVEVHTDAAKDNERTRQVMCKFDPDWFREASALPARWDNEQIARCFDMNNPHIEQAMQRLGVEASTPGFASTLLIESLATTIMVELSRHFLDKDRDLRVRTRDGELPQTHLQRIYEYIESFENRCPSIDEIAKLCNISPAHLRRSFKNTTGQTVHQYVEGVRLAKAKALLAETDLPLKEISYRLGFADSSTFSSTFRKSSGETPSGYRFRSRI